MKKHRKTTSEEDDLSAISTATPIISNNSQQKRRPRSRRMPNDDDWGSNVTPVISNITPETSSHDQYKKNTSDIDYGQMVVDSRNSFKPTGEQGRINPPRRKTSGRAPTKAGNTTDRNGTTNPGNRNHSSMDAQTSLVNEPNGTNSQTPQSAWWRGVGIIWLPFLVTLFCTIRFLLSTTASLTCRFIEVDIGFIPANIKFASSKIQLGPFAYERGKCLSYPEDFSKLFIHGQSSWRASRVAAVVNIVLGFFVFITAAFVLLYKVLRFWPSSARFTTCIKGFDKIWETVVFMLVILTFIFEVVKFAFWGVNLCTEEVWMNDEYSFVPAKECSLSTGAKCSLSAMTFDLILVILLTVISRNLRVTLRKMFCCRKCKRRRRNQPVNTEEDEEMPEPRYFFDGRDDEDGASIVPNVRNAKNSSQESNSDEESVIPRPTQKQKGGISFGSGKKNGKKSRNPTQGQRKPKANRRRNDSDEESIISRGDLSSASRKIQTRWANSDKNDSDCESLVPMPKRGAAQKGANSGRDGDSESDSGSGSSRSDSGSESSGSDSGSNSSESDVLQGTGKNESKPIESDAFSDDLGTADLLGFNEPIVEAPQHCVHKRDDSDEIGFPNLL